MEGITIELYLTGTFKFTHYSRSSQGATVQKRLRIINLSFHFRYGKSVLLNVLIRGTVVNCRECRLS